MKVMLGLLLISIMMSFTAVLTAQQSINITSDSAILPSGACPLPTYSQTTVWGNASNFNPAVDSILVTFYWGDGTLDSGMSPLYGTGPTHYWNLGMTHNYFAPGSYETRVIARAPNGMTDTLITSSITVTSHCEVIDGFVYVDENENCVKDAGEPVSAARTVYIKNSSDQTIAVTTTDGTGYFKLTVPTNLTDLTLGCFIHSVFSESVTCPSQGYHTFNSTSSQSLNLAFGEPTPGVLARVHHVGMCGVAAPGDTGVISFKASIKFNTSNDYTDTLRVELSDQVSYVEMLNGPEPDDIIDNTVYWYRTISANAGGMVIDEPLFRFSTRTNINAALLSDALFTMGTSLHPLDIRASDNYDIVRLKVDGPYDPNNKEVSPAGAGPTGLIDTSTVELTYTVNFQNTGTAPAKHVYILDTLPSELDLSSFELVGATHDVKASQGGDGVIRFDFRNINLPDSNSNEPESHGSVVFKMNLLEELPIGTQIKNRVGIYFDYNAPVITNYAISTLYDEPFIPDSLVISTQSSDVVCLNSDNGEASVTVISGNPPYSYAWSNGAATRKIEDIAPGTYSITVTDNEGFEVSEEIVVDENRQHPDPTVGKVSVTMSVQAWESYIYTMDNVANNFFEWDALGGEVLDAANNQAEILWYGGPTGTILVTQISEHGCKASRDTEVPILFVGQDELEISSLSIYPNPSSERIYLSAIPEGSKVSVSIYDLSGRQVAMQGIRSIDQSIYIGTLSAGPYMVRLTQDGELLGTTLMVKE